MQVPLQITYRRCDPSESLNTLLREKTLELERFFPRITGCHVFVERPGNHHRKGKGAHYRVRVELTVPGGILVVSKDPALRMMREDAFLAASDAFREIRRQLQDHVHKLRRQVKSSVRSPHARVAQLRPELGFGFLQTPDGREVYFHRASVLDDAFERLEVGAEVRFFEELGDKGPQASTVQVVGRGGHHDLSVFS
jgi:cold shock CspA family protein/ribosome-associated translation inhibitor RaiA